MVGFPDVDSLSRISWNALSRFLSRGVLATRGDKLYRPTGLNTEGELEVTKGGNTVNLQELEGIGWVVAGS